ncbi:DUF4150 domain-containing protein [Sorangium sp. So ce429]
MADTMAAMGQYNLVADPDSLNLTAVQGWIDQIRNAPGGANFLSSADGGGTIVVTDNPAKLSEGNVQRMSDQVAGAYNVRITDRNRLFSYFNGFAQNGGRMIFINPNNPAGKSPANILVHEIGHRKWPGLGSETSHHPLFYRLLRDNLDALGLPVDRYKDLNGLTDEQLNQTPVPGGDSLRYNSGPPREGTRKQVRPKVVSLAPSVNLTPMGAAAVPVPYPVVGNFEESEKTTPSVRFTSNQSFTMASYIPTVHGDAPGSAGGVKSGTVSARAEPIEHSAQVRAEKFEVVRHDDLFWMNNRNTKGRAVFNPTGSA